MANEVMSDCEKLKEKHPHLQHFQCCKLCHADFENQSMLGDLVDGTEIEVCCDMLDKLVRMGQAIGPSPFD